jgi:hypothetical protein
MLARVSGPMKFRLVLQPLMASFFAIRDGVADARAGRLPYFSKLVAGSRIGIRTRTETVKSGWKSVGKVFILAIVLDVVYQLWELHTVHPIQAFVVAVILAIVPYLILCGITNRIARREMHRPPSSPPLPDAPPHRH